VVLDHSAAQMLSTGTNGNALTEMLFNGTHGAFGYERQLEMGMVTTLHLSAVHYFYVN
jgi:hypothetical protein